MLTNNELPNNIKRIPTSQMVFYMTVPGLTNDKKQEINYVLFDRLTRRYKLHPLIAQSFVSIEQDIINLRGYNIESYNFGQDRRFKDILKIFYENNPAMRQPLDEGFTPSTLTMSEMVDFNHRFVDLSVKLLDRIKKIEKVRAKQNVLHARGGSLYVTPEQEFEALNAARKIISDQIANEKTLSEYYEMMAQHMRAKIRTLMGTGCSYKEHKKTQLIIIKESILMWQRSPIKTQEMRSYEDISYPAGDVDKTIISSLTLK